MSTSQHTFDQVRSILSKLDRDIDAARERRLQNGRPIQPQPATQTIDQPEPGTHEVDPGKSGYGKARPLRRNADNGFLGN